MPHLDQRMHGRSLTSLATGGIPVALVALILGVAAPSAASRTQDGPDAGKVAPEATPGSHSLELPAVAFAGERFVVAQATATPTRWWGDYEPPPLAHLTVLDETQEAAVSTYCWGGFCDGPSDGWLTPHEPLQLGSPFVGQFAVDEERVPTAMYLQLYRFASYVGEDHWSRAALWPAELATPLGPLYALPPARSQDVQLSRVPGLYVVSLRARWEDVGEVTYGFLVEVEE